MMTLDIDFTGALRVMSDIAAIMNVGAHEMVANETRLLMLELIRKTPPRTQKQGERAIEHDLTALFTHVNQDFLARMGNEFGYPTISHWATLSDGRRIFLDWKKMDNTGSGMKEFHEQSRNNRGRISKGFKGNNLGDGKWKARYVVSNEDYATFLASRKQRVGWMKSGWLKGLQAVDDGARVAQFIKRHSGKWGDVRSNLDNQSQPSITISNNAPNIRVMRHIVDAACATRLHALERRLRRALSGIRDDVVAGRRVQKIKVENN